MFKGTLLTDNKEPNSKQTTVGFFIQNKGEIFYCEENKNFYKIKNIVGRDCHYCVRKSYSKKEKGGSIVNCKGFLFLDKERKRQWFYCMSGIEFMPLLLSKKEYIQLLLEEDYIIITKYYKLGVD